MSSLQRYDKDGVEIIINLETGESFASISGYARMANKDKSTISRRLSTVASSDNKTGEIQTQQGLRTVALISEDLITEWIIQDNPTVAAQLMKLGVRVFLHQMAGYKVTSEAMQPKQEAKQPERRLPPVRDSIDYANAIETVTKLPDSHLKRLVEKMLVKELTVMETNNHLLATATEEKPPQYTTAPVRAKDLGYTVTQIKEGSTLGKYVKKHIEPSFQDYSGQFLTNFYEITEELDKVIHAYFVGR